MDLTEKFLQNTFATFKQSKYGKILSKQLRYEVFKPQDVSFETWVKYLGPNGNNLKHMPHTHEQTKKLMKHSDLTNNEKSQLYLAALIHDWGETIVGDVNYRVKTDNDTVEEKQAFEKFVKELFPDKKIRNTLLNIHNEIAMQPDTKLGRIFNAIERVGYISDAIRMTNLLETNGYTAPQREIFIRDCQENCVW